MMNAEGLVLEPMRHRGADQIAVRGRLLPLADEVVRKFRGRQYSKTQACWYVPYTREALYELREKLGKVQRTVISGFSDTPVAPSTVVVIRYPLPEGYHEKLVLRRMSEMTISTYESQMRMFLIHLHPRRAEDITEKDIKAYLVYLATIKRVSISTQNTAVNAIKFYLEQVKGGDRSTYYIDRPVKERLLPRVLSQEEVKAMIEVTRNPKHRCMLLLMYSSGLRLGELLHLRWGDFDADRRQLFIAGGKGKKDRYTLLPEEVYAFARYYMSLYRPREFFFEGQDGGSYSRKSVSMVVKRAAFLAGVRKRVSPHTLRHSFGTHLMENGVDVRYIQVLMGHESIRTTEQYTHVTIKALMRIRSPIEALGLSGSLNPPKGLVE